MLYAVCLLLTEQDSVMQSDYYRNASILCKKINNIFLELKNVYVF